MEKKNVFLISLGCEKNLVDSEMILGMFKNDSNIITDINKADVIIINTCGFIKDAKEEAINTIIESLDYQPKAKIVVTGCLAQRYLDDLKREIPEVDLFVPLKDYDKFGELLYSLFEEDEYKGYFLSSHKRLISTPQHLAYVKISDGCDNRCSYCAIPLIRGSFRSFPKNDIIAEVQSLVMEGRKEICLISQDLTRYGSDINESLADLLKEIALLEGDFKIRLLYLYPDEITDELIDVISKNNKIMPYFDIPIQHASNKILKLMSRRGTKEEIRDLVNKIRNKVSGAIIRTTIIVGFPHEVEKDFNELIDFVNEMKFDHLGAFMYSKEEDTKAFDMSMQVSSRVKKERYEKLLDTQKWISLNQNKKHIGKIYDAVIERYERSANKYIARTYFLAPDDIDGSLYIESDIPLEISKIYKVEIIDCTFYDLHGRVV